MGILDDFTYAQIAPRLMPGEQIFGMGYVTVWVRSGGRFEYTDEPRLGAATDRRLFLVHTEKERDYPQPRNLGLTEWWYEDLLLMDVKYDDHARNEVQFALGAKPGLGPGYEGRAERVTVHGNPHLGFSNPMPLRSQFVPWLLPRVQGRAFPPTAERAAQRDALVREQQAAYAQKQAVSAANSKASAKRLPLRLAFAGAAACLLGTLLFAYAAVLASTKAGRHLEAAERNRGYAAEETTKEGRQRVEGNAELEEQFAANSKNDLLMTGAISVVCLGGFVGMLFVVRRQRRKLAAA